MSIEVRRPILGVGVAVIREGKLLLIQRGRGHLAGRWAVPGGKVRLGETLEAAAVREVREETGLEVELREIVWVGETIGPGDPPAWHYVLIDYLGEVVEGDLSPGDDAAAATWVDLISASEMDDLTPTMYSLVKILSERFADRTTGADERSRP